MSNNDLWCSKCKSHHHPADCPLDQKSMTPSPSPKIKQKCLECGQLEEVNGGGLCESCWSAFQDLIDYGN